MSDAEFDLFIELSSALTGYDLKNDPWQMDAAEAYEKVILEKKGEAALRAVLDAYAACKADAAGDAGRLNALVGQRLMAGDGSIPALCRTILWLWYLSAWYDQPVIGAWPNIYPPGDGQGDIVPGLAYSRGLAFQVGQSHPPGYTETRYGSWGAPPPPDPGPFYPPSSPAPGGAGPAR